MVSELIVDVSERATYKEFWSMEGFDQQGCWVKCYCVKCRSVCATKKLIIKDVIGSPCLNPFLVGNSYIGLPLIKMDIVMDFKHPLIQPIHLLLKSSFVSYSKENPNTLNHRLFQNLLWTPSTTSFISYPRPLPN